MVLALTLATAPAAMADDTKAKQGARQVESSAKQIGQGVQDTAKGIGQTVVGGAETAGGEDQGSGAGGGARGRVGPRPRPKEGAVLARPRREEFLHEALRLTSDKPSTTRSQRRERSTRYEADPCDVSRDGNGVRARRGRLGGGSDPDHSHPRPRRRRAGHAPAKGGDMPMEKKDKKDGKASDKQHSKKKHAAKKAEGDMKPGARDEGARSQEVGNQEAGSVQPREGSRIHIGAAARGERRAPPAPLSPSPLWGEGRVRGLTPAASPSRIFPVALFGSSSTIVIRRGYL